LIGRFAYWLAGIFGLSKLSQLKAYFFFNRTARKDLISKSKDRNETWREYYIRIYGCVPDFAKHPNNGYYRDLEGLKPNIDIAGTIKAEEEKYINLFEHNKEMIVKKYSHKLDGKTLAKLHHTYGCDPTMVEDALNIFLPEQLHSDYLKEYEKHKLTGRNG